MDITLVGWLLIPLGIAAFFLVPQWLYFSTIFLIPFSATAVANAESTGLPAVMFVGCLWVCREIVVRVSFRRLKVPAHVRMFGGIGMFYVLCLGFSLFVPLLMTGTVILKSPILNDPQTTALVFSVRNITQYLYVCFWILAAWLIVIRNLTLEAVGVTLKIFLISAVFVCCWGLLQWASYEMGFPYPDTLFNSSASDFARGYTAELQEIGVKRITSVAVEPSILAQYLLCVLPVVFCAVWYRRPILSVAGDRAVLILVLLVLLLSASATSYLGVAFFILGVPFALHLWRRGLFSYVSWVATLGLAVIVTIVLVPKLSSALSGQVVDKIGTYSVQERLYTISNAWNYFLEFPWLGLGWGSVTSHDLIVNLLANSGLIGLFAFSLLVLHPAVGLKSALKRWGQERECGPEYAWGTGIFLSFLLMLFVSAVGGFGYVFGHFWFTLAMVVSLGRLISSDKSGKGHRVPGTPSQVSSWERHCR